MILFFDDQRMITKPRVLRITTVPISLKLLLQGQLSFFKRSGFEVLAVSADGPEVESLQKEGIPHQVIHMTRVVSPFQDLISVIKLIKAIRKFKPQIVHTHTPKAGMVGMIAAWACSVPIRFHTVAGLPVMERTGILRLVLILTEKITYACATRVYPNSQGLKNFIEKNIGTKTPLRIIGKGSSNGIDTSFFAKNPALEEEAFSFRCGFGVSSSSIVFAFIGRIVRDKGINELLLAFDIVSSKLDCKLLLAGPFEDALDPISEASRKIIANNKNVIILGYINDVRPMLLASDVFVFPSYREGFPNVVMQACCMECPCIVSDINGCNEIIKHGESGLIVPPKHVGALVDAMRQLATHPLERKLLSEKARRYVVKNFDQKFFWSELLNEYRKSLK